MIRLVHAGAAPLLLAVVIGISGCGSTDSTPVRSPTTVTRTVTGSTTAAPEPPSSASPTSPRAPAPGSSRPTAPSAVADESSVVRDYFAAINARDYRRAWELGGRNLSGSYQAFAAGFATTAHDTVHIFGTAGDTVTIGLEATQTDGSLRLFEGTYTVHGGTIVAADVREVTGPQPRPSGPSPSYENCDEVRAAGAAPLHWWEPGYAPHLDRDGDGVACE
ncbi:excalibur calcium-binding domain-containing protein [Streptomyces sp. MS06]|uniref:excalibur calcium-binding domain-containing protein n=1 Tax=Streptomyces sp. MS06 TaxID=3385974 RepID=UPI0039A19E2D